MSSMFKLCLISSSGFRGDQMLKSNNRQSAGKSSIEPLTPPSKNLLIVQYCWQSKLILINNGAKLVPI